MYALHLYPLRNMQIYVRKIPYPLNTVRHELFRHFHRTFLGNREYRDVNPLLPDKLLHFFHRTHQNTMDLHTTDLRIIVKNPPEDKASALKVPVIHQRLSQMTGADDDQIVLLIQAQYPSDLLIEIFHIVSVPLLAKSPEIIQILSDLGCRHLHDIAQLLRRDALDPLIFQFTQISEIPGKAADHSL